MAVHLPVMYIAGCSGCVRITERHHRHVNYSRIVVLGIRDERFSSHGGGDGWHEIKGGECLSELREGDGNIYIQTMEPIRRKATKRNRRRSNLMLTVPGRMAIILLHLTPRVPTSTSHSLGRKYV